ncbi:MAG: DUF4230 domain-containing protein [Clostridiales bacterium]|nr:DUF4230 domain-containing protein [Clostridiales bacterium]
MNDYEYVNGRIAIPKQKTGILKKIANVFTGILATVGVIAIVVTCAGWKIFNNTDTKVKKSGSREAIISEEEKFHGIILTNDTVMTELNAISELMTYSENYAGTATVVDSIQVPYTDMDIWGTQHQIEIMYSGTIKVGYDLEQVKVTVNNQKKEIYVVLPKTPIVDNNLPQEKVTVVQDNNVFNPIRADEVNVRLSEIKEDQMRIAVENGIYEAAETHMKEIIVKTLAQVHSDYTVVFLDSVAR